jgi:hypothetical protein
MKNKKVIREQSSPTNAGSTTIDLTQSVKLKCFDRFKWFVIDRGVQPVKTKTGKQVVSGKNKKGDTVFFYGDGNVTNVTANPKVTKKWSCSSLNQSDPIITSDQNLTGDQKEYKDGLVAKYGVVLDVDPVELKHGKWTQIDLNTDKTYGNSSLFTEPGKYFVYLQQSEQTVTKPEQQAIINKWKAANYVEVPCNTTLSDDFATKINLKNSTEYGSAFATDFCMALKVDFTVTPNEFNTFLNDNEPKITSGVSNTDKKMCRQLINMYIVASDKKFPVENNVMITTAKEYIKSCNSQHKFMLGTQKNLEKILVSRSRYVGKYGLRESDLKKIIKTNILEAKENKKSVLTEQKIIISRYSIISEGIKSKSKKSQKDVASKMLTEMISLRKQGFSEELLMEEEKSFFSSMGSLFGGGFLDTFKEIGMKWVLEKLGLAPNSYISEVLQTAAGELSLSEIPKLFSDCNFTSEWVAHSFAEGYVKKLMDEKGFDGIFMSTVRNGLVEALQNSDFYKSIASSLTPHICRMLGGLGDKLDKVSSTVKDKVLAN